MGITIALDAMGGDFAPFQTVKGAVEAAESSPDIQLVLVGREDDIQTELAKYSQVTSLKNIQIVHASEVVSMSDPPSISFRKKKDSSIQVALRLVREGKADAFVSAGNTGACMAAATLILGRISNVDRPAIATVFPTNKGPVLLLDMGATVDSRPQNLLQFAGMGLAYAELVLGIKKPRLGLLNIGEEVEKGNQLTQAAYELLKTAFPNFIGNIESKFILKHVADVIVCDGFVGNSVLKFGESIVETFMQYFKEERRKSFLSVIGLLLLYPAFKRFKKIYDYEETGGAPLLGVNGVSIIAHGSSSSKSICNALKTAVQCVEGQIIHKIEGTVTA